MIPTDKTYLIMIVFAIIVFIIGFLAAKGLAKEKTDELMEVNKQLKQELEQCQQD
jgi:ABC-type lipoprotein release transport system permease subunit